MPNFEMSCGCFMSCTCGGPDPGGFGYQEPRQSVASASVAPSSDPVRALARAQQADPGNTFVAAIQRFYNRHGHLSAKQIAALDRVTPTLRGRRLDYAGPPNSWSAGDHDDYGLCQSWDWAGGE